MQIVVIREGTPMYVCLCQGITDKQIHAEVERGADTWKEVRENLGVAKQCGRCGQCAKGIVREAVAEKHAVATLPLAI